jgi:tetratricopeptide (TPR) repeat protein
MGTWGGGNFDDDTAAAHLHALMSGLVKEVSTAMADPGDIQPDEYWGCAVPCNIEILNLIARQRWSGTNIPKPAIVEQWKRDYLAVWDQHIDLLEPTPKHKIDRRAVLVKTFDELFRHALWNDNDHDDIVARLGTPSDAFEREVLARALVDKAIVLSRGGQREEAIAICEDVVARFGNASELALREKVALAFSWKAHSLAALGRIEEAIAIYDDVAARFGAASEPGLVERAAMAMFDKAWRLKEAGRVEEAAAAYRALIDRFGAVEHAQTRHIVKRSEEFLAVLK